MPRDANALNAAAARRGDGRGIDDRAILRALESFQEQDAALIFLASFRWPKSTANRAARC